MEFVTIVKSGVITIPEEYDFLNDKKVKVSIVSEEVYSRNKESMKLALNEVINLDPFKKIENPVDWQRSIRDDWQ